MKIHLLYGSGLKLTGTFGTTFSKKAFKTVKEALEDIPRFEKKITDKKGFYKYKKDSLEIVIMDFDIEIQS